MEKILLHKIVGAVEGQNPTTRGPAGGNPLPREIFEVIALVRIANVGMAYVERRIGKDEIELPKRWHNLSAIAAQYFNGCRHYFTPSPIVKKSTIAFAIWKRLPLYPGCKSPGSSKPSGFNPVAIASIK